MTGGYDYFYTLQEICVLLNLLPNTFRQIAREYADVIVLREQVRKGRPVMGLPRPDFEALRRVVEMRSHGVTSDEIRRAVSGLTVSSGRATTATEGATGAVPVVDRPAPNGDEDAMAVPAGRGEAAQSPPAEPRSRPRPDVRLYGTPRGSSEVRLREVMAVEGTQALGDQAGDVAGVSPAAEADGDVFPAFADAGGGEAAAAEDVAVGELPLPEDAGGQDTAGVGHVGPGEVFAVRPPGEFADGPEAVETLLGTEIAALREELQKMDEHRRDERDKLLTVLMRTQQELQSLRYEVGISLSRRDRKRKRGFWAWLLDL